MFVVRLMRWVRGYVLFTVTGAFGERFLNLVARARVAIWDITRKGEEMTACVLARDYKRLRPCVRRTGVRLRVTQRHGLPFYTRRYDKRAGLVLGIVIFFTFIIVMSQFVWSVEISGNREVSEFEITQALRDEGICPGALKKDVDVRAAKQNILLKLTKLSWITINIMGTNAQVEVRERAPQPQMVPVDRPGNVIAAKSGQIIRMEVYGGQAMVKKGDSVKEGDLLVSGVVQGKTGLNLLSHSSAKIIAQIQEQMVYDIPGSVEIGRETGNQRTKRFLSLLGAEIPVWFCGPIHFDYRLTTQTTQLSLFGAKLPVYYKQEVHRELVRVTRDVSAEEARAAAEHLIAEYEVKVLKAEEVISREFSVEQSGSDYRVTVKLVANADIAREQEIFTENSQ